MMKKMYQRMGAVGTAAVLTAALTVPAFAAESSNGIAVQLNGENVAFTDAAPVVNQGRTFLPFRAVFEAMGVQVSNEGNTITAVRGDKTLQMTIGSTTATVTEGGKTSTITMDVAPYVDSATWRTYVPVRFAAEAFGCNVGWDADDQTVLIVDMDKLFGDATFTKMDNYISYLYKQQEGKNQATNGTVSLTAGVNKALIGSEEDLNLKMNGTVTGISSTTASQMAVELDLSDLAPLLAGDPAALGEEGLAQLKDSLSKTQLEVRMDVNTGKLYFYAPMLEAVQGGSGWYSLDLNALMKQSGLDFTQLVTMSAQNFSLEDTLRTALSVLPLDDKDVDYTVLSTLADTYVQLFGDSAFTQNGDTYTATYTQNVDGVDMTYTTVLTAQGEDIVSMQMNMDMAANAEGMNMNMGFKVYADSTKSTMDMNLDVSGLVTVTFNMDLGYQATDKAPETGLPEGVTATPLDGMVPTAASTNEVASPAR